MAAFDIAERTTMPDARTLRRVRSAVVAWYDTQRRDLPWRATTDPYAVLVSEVMLQQTQAGRVAPRFERFMRRFPTVEALAAAEPADVLAEWSGLGYNRRALALRRAAESVARNGWPPSVAELERLPGVGPYTARAIASLAFGQAVGVVDTNVRRWLVRRFGADASAAAGLQRLADALAAEPRSAADAATWTHASMELGATVCGARTPRCEACPLARGCPSRGSAPRVERRRQPPLRGSARAWRGAVIRALSTADAPAMPEAMLRDAATGDGMVGPPLPDAGWRQIIEGLVRDGLVHHGPTGIALGEARIGS